MNAAGSERVAPLGIQELPALALDRIVTLGIATLLRECAVPALARGLDSELDVWPCDVDATEQSARGVVHRMLPHGSGQAGPDDRALDQTLEAAVGSATNPVRACEHPAQRRGAALPRSVYPSERLLDPPLAEAFAERVVEGLLHDVVVDD